MDDTQLDTIEAIWLRDFIGENWRAFCDFMADRDQTEEDADAVVDKLDKLADA